MSELRSVLVTGASAGIGAAIATAFGALGWKVAIGARRTERLEEVAQAVSAAGGHPFAARLDVGNPASVDAFFTAAEAALGPIDVVVSNAGIGIPGLLHELAVEDLQTELATNLLGPMLVARRALPTMLERRNGVLAFVSSMNVVQPRPFQVAYTAAKAGVEGLAHTLRLDLEGTGVRSVIVRPGATRSEFSYGWDPEILTRVLDSWQSWGLLRHTEMLDPEQIAAAVVTAVTTPAAAGMDLIQLNPTGPKDP